MAKKISDENRIINALDAKGWTDAIAYQTPETFGGKSCIYNKLKFYQINYK
jgi:hypothetical protein